MLFCTFLFLTHVGLVSIIVEINFDPFNILASMKKSKVAYHSSEN